MTTQKMVRLEMTRVRNDLGNLLVSNGLVTAFVLLVRFYESIVITFLKEEKATGRFADDLLLCLNFVILWFSTLCTGGGCDV